MLSEDDERLTKENRALGWMQLLIRRTKQYNQEMKRLKRFESVSIPALFSWLVDFFI